MRSPRPEYLGRVQKGRELRHRLMQRSPRARGSQAPPRLRPAPGQAMPAQRSPLERNSFGGISTSKGSTQIIRQSPLHRRLPSARRQHHRHSSSESQQVTAPLYNKVKDFRPFSPSLSLFLFISPESLVSRTDAAAAAAERTEPVPHGPEGK